MASPSAALDAVLLHHPVWRGGALAQSALQAVPTGHARLDRELPGGGWPAGALSEILCADEGIGELQLVLPALAALSRAGTRVAWLAPPHLPYAPALAAAGVRQRGKRGQHQLQLADAFASAQRISVSAPAGQPPPGNSRSSRA